MRVNVSGRTLVFPRQCACCSLPTEGSRTFAATRVTGKRVVRHDTRSWTMPFCAQCRQHADAMPGPWGCLAVTFGICTVGIGFYVLARSDDQQRERARALMQPTCASVGDCVEYLGWSGTIHSFDFASRTYAAAFALANSAKVVSVSHELRVDLDALRSRLEREQAERDREEANRAARARHVAEEGDVHDVLGKIESAKGPAARRAALERGLRGLSRADLRDRLVVEAARIEVRAVLDKVEGLKSPSAKRRHLEECLAAVRADAIHDDLQRREIELLEEALAQV